MQRRVWYDVPIFFLRSTLTGGADAGVGHVHLTLPLPPFFSVKQVKENNGAHHSAH